MPDSQNVADLFGDQLAAPGAATETAKPFEDGVYVVRGLSMKKGVYEKGRWQGRPYARFTYEFQDGSVRRQASQMLPWLPGVGFFETNFRIITGMSLTDFRARCAQDQMDAAAQSRFFQGLFRGAAYEAELKQQGQWLNVWRLKTRVAEPENADAAPPAASAVPAEPASPSAEAAVAAVTAPEVPSAGEWDARVRESAARLGLDAAALDDVSVEEFAVPYASLSDMDKMALADVLRDRVSGGEA